MKTDPSAKRVLLYGDSLVYGKKPGVNERWGSEVRFSGIIQRELGNEFDVIEEGLRGRTLKHENSFFPERNGLEQFGPIVGSHLAVDLVVVALGSNDCNATGKVQKNEVESALDQYRSKISEWCTFLNTPVPKLLIVTPPRIIEEYYDEPMKTVFGPKAPKKQVKLESAIINYCQVNNLDYLVSSKVCSPSKNGDGIHLDEAGNLGLGSKLFDKVTRILG
jgi:lysophospholipase L1-like esterase